MVGQVSLFGVQVARLETRHEAVGWDTAGIASKGSVREKSLMVFGNYVACHCRMFKRKFSRKGLPIQDLQKRNFHFSVAL